MMSSGQKPRWKKHFPNMKWRAWKRLTGRQRLRVVGYSSARERIETT